MTPRPSFLRVARRVAFSNRLVWVFAGLAVVVSGLLALIVGLSPAFAVFLVVLVVGIAVALLTWRQRRSPNDQRLGVGTVVAHSVIAVVATLALIQAVPYGRAHANPPVTGEPAWSSPRVRELIVNACFDCHSNETTWPWYSNVAPISWAVQDHVDEARDKVNYSEFATDPRKARDTIEVIEDGSMPPGYFTSFGRHPEARLTEAEVAELIAGLKTTPGMGDDKNGEGDDKSGDREGG